MSGENSTIRVDIQGLRAIAVSLVVLDHAGVPGFSGGYVGVDIFFVISGFLITSHLLRQVERTGRVSFAEFYARRARRLLPAALTVVALSVVAGVLFLPPLVSRGLWTDAVAAALYVPNILFADRGVNYLAETAPSIFQHYWSLGVEEQFYLVWPLVLVVLWRVTRGRRLWLSIAVLVALSFAACLLVASRQQPYAFFLLPTRAWELGAGALLAVVATAGWRRTTRVALSWVGLALMIAAGVLYSDATKYPGWATLVPVAGAALVIAAATDDRSGAGRVLGLRPLRFLGDISYSLYLVHWPIIVIPQLAQGPSHPVPLGVNLTLVVASVGVAWLLYHGVENPGRTWTWLVSARPARTGAAVVVASGLVVAVASAGVAVARQLPLDAGRPAPEARIAQPPQFTDYVPSDLAPSLLAASGDNPELYASGCHLSFTATDATGCSFGSGERTVALFGDSHAAQWFPGIKAAAEDLGIKVVSYTKSSCPSVEIPTSRGGNRYRECDVWRAAVVKRIRSTSPDLVLISNFGRPGDESAEAAAAWQEGLQSTIDKIGTGPKVAVVSDTPDLGETPSSCLSAHLEDTRACGVPSTQQRAAKARAADRAAAQQTGSTYLDLLPYLCDDTTCTPVIGQYLVYRDQHHLTATFSEALAPVWKKRLQELLPQA